MGISIFGAVGWILCSLIYTVVTIYLCAIGRKNDDDGNDDLLHEELMAIPTDINVAAEGTEPDSDDKDIEVAGTEPDPDDKEIVVEGSRPTFGASARRKPSNVSC